MTSDILYSFTTLNCNILDFNMYVSCTYFSYHFTRYYQRSFSCAVIVKCGCFMKIQSTDLVRVFFIFLKYVNKVKRRTANMALNVSRWMEFITMMTRIWTAVTVSILGSEMQSCRRDSYIYRKELCLKVFHSTRETAWARFPVMTCTWPNVTLRMVTHHWT